MTSGVRAFAGRASGGIARLQSAIKWGPGGGMSMPVSCGVCSLGAHCTRETRNSKGNSIRGGHGALLHPRRPPPRAKQRPPHPTANGRRGRVVCVSGVGSRGGENLAVRGGRARQRPTGVYGAGGTGQAGQAPGEPGEGAGVERSLGEFNFLIGEEKTQATGKKTGDGG